jgi:hypothetical protein
MQKALKVLCNASTFPDRPKKALENRGTIFLRNLIYSLCNSTVKSNTLPFILEKQNRLRNCLVNFFTGDRIADPDQ